MFYYLRQWLHCLKIYALICAFVSGPERLPHGPHCVFLSVFSYFLLGFALVDNERGYATVAVQILFELSLLGLVALAGLKWKGALSRFNQTFSALVGINLVISAVTLPVFHLIVDDSNIETAVPNTLIYATMAMVFWNLAVLSQIFKRSFDVNTIMSAMIAFNYFVVYKFTVIWF